MKNIVLLGSTGSIGKNVIDVVRHFPDRFNLIGISSNNNAEDLLKQIEEFKPESAVIGNKEEHSFLEKNVTGKTKISSGMKSIEELAHFPDADIVLIAISGTAALKPLISALGSGKTVALASKEPIVSAGCIIKKIAQRHSAKIIPIDSEHSAIMQCLSGRDVSEVRTLLITGSGGSLKNKEKREFGSVSVEEVLSHPKWNMGRKITVDSATLMNKGLEVIEARWLFDIPQDKIKVVIHPEAIVHSMIEFVDGTMSACMFSPDMRFPILKALSFPEIIPNDFPRLDFSAIKELTFDRPDLEKFPALGMAYEVLEKGGTYPAALNSANEAAVKLFLDGKIRFVDIVSKVRDVLDKHKGTSDPTLDDIINAERSAFEEVLRSC